jgi:hypothetical protein|tara:strand:+ start:1637 stop:2362 length:726 start_codon:yes stop_codon:yes gene_type:complete
MQKSKLDKFIQKYNLGGNVNSVKWISDGDSLSTSFVTPDKSLLGTVKIDNFKFEESDVGIYKTDQLKSLIGVLSDDISLTLLKFGDKAVTLKVNDNYASIDYVLSDLSVIADPPALKRLPKFGTQIKVDTKFINTFIKGKGALGDIDTFTIINNKKSGKVEIVIGYASTNTNRVIIPVETIESDLNTDISFNANLFKEVLIANRECTSATFEVSNEGLARVNFKVDDYDSTYYIVAMQDVD